MRLKPVGVPWQVSPSTPELRVRVSEDGSETVVEARCTLCEAGKYRDARIALSFDRGLYLHFSQSYSDAEVVREADYDWTEVPTIDPQRIEESRHRLQSLWDETGKCPDPGVYEVENSSWSEEVAEQALRHYLIVGHDAYVELLAAGLDWSVISES